MLMGAHEASQTDRSLIWTSWVCRKCADRWAHEASQTDRSLSWTCHNLPECAESVQTDGSLHSFKCADSALISVLWTRWTSERCEKPIAPNNIIWLQRKCLPVIFTVVIAHRVPGLGVHLMWTLWREQSLKSLFTLTGHATTRTRVLLIQVAWVCV